MDSQYDEFGNYIGPELEDDSEVEEMYQEPVKENDWANDDEMEDAPNVSTMVPFDEEASKIVLHEDKQYYPSASDVYPGAEILVEEEDTQPLETPIIAPIKEKCFEHVEKELPETSFSFEYMTGLMDHPQLIRNICVAGHLHHGKTLFMDLLVQQSHIKDWAPEKEIKYTDTRLDEHSRGISIKSTPISMVLPCLSGKSYLIHAMDTPGHVNFEDEVCSSLRIMDGCVLIVDAAEGVMVGTQRCIKNAVAAGCEIILVINKLDRLFLELKLPPTDAFFKLQNVIEEVNATIQQVKFGAKLLSPAEGNVVFASAKYGFSFTLQSFAKKYCDYYGGVNYNEFAKRLWNKFYNSNSRKFTTKPSEEGDARAFVHFLLEPVYKIFSHVLACEADELSAVLESIGVRVKPSELTIDAMPLLKIVLSRFFVDSSGFIEAVVRHLSCPTEAAPVKIPLIYSGDLSNAAGKVEESLLQCSSTGPLMIHVSKLYPRPDATEFDSFGRVFAGTVRVGDEVRVMGESFGYSANEDEEDVTTKQITRIWVYNARYRVEVNQVKAGNVALFEGIDGSITKTATITLAKDPFKAVVFRPLHYRSKSIMKIAIEPINPAELPKMLDGLRKLNKSYPLLTTRVEESGEHILLTPGELYADCVLHDLRKMFSSASEIKVADPVVTFCETVSETSSIWCFAQTPNKKNKLTMLAEPMQAGLSEDIESEAIRLIDPKTVSDFFSSKYGWDALSSRSVWSFGPDTQGPNILVDDTLPGSVKDQKKLLYSIKDSITQGFQWAAREGPLCDEPIRNVKFRLTDAIVADSAMMRSGGQIIPTSRRVAYSAFLLAVPRLMEPVYFCEIQAPADAVKAVYNVLAKRRGHVVLEIPKPGTPLYTVHAYLPVMDSFGFETDLRTHTMGQAFCQCVFDHWEIVPGDPLDKSIPVRPLEPASGPSLARDFMVKTRRRKGLAEDVSINKFFDDEMFVELAKQDGMSMDMLEE